MIPAAAAAFGASLILVAIAGLHAGLALGAPWGRLAWGGRHEGILPPRLQLGSALSIPALVGMAMLVLIRAGAIYPQWSAGMYWPVWAVFLFLTTNTFGNFASKSAAERRVMGPISALAAVLVGVVAFE